MTMETPQTPILLGEIPAGPVTPGIMASLQKAINDTVPADKNGVLVQVHDARGQPLAFGVAVKVGEHFQFAGEGELAHSWTPVAGTVSAVYMW